MIYVSTKVEFTRFFAIIRELWVSVRGNSLFVDNKGISCKNLSA